MLCLRLRCAEGYSASPRVKRTCAIGTCVGGRFLLLRVQTSEVMSNSSEPLSAPDSQRTFWNLRGSQRDSQRDSQSRRAVLAQAASERCLLEPLFEGCPPIVNCSGIDERMIDTCRRVLRDSREF